MATADKPRRSPKPPREHDAQMYHPLDRLRGTIRRYVVAEGLLSALLFVSVWFSLGLLFDFGLFKATGWDWALDGSRAIRGFALVAAVGLFAAILVVRIFLRLTKEFSYPALALVLERRFPKILGDRLITAVEMADVDKMTKFGYSREMIEATIAEARERVAQVPVSKVFNWKRLWVMAGLSFGLLFGTVAVAFASHAVATRSVSPYRFAWKFAHVTGIFAERNVALMNTPWPRRAHVELVGFPASGEATVSQAVASVPVTARAYKWVVADRTVAEGWRPMRWSDVTADLAGRPAPEFDFRLLRQGDEAPGGLPATASAWTVDQIEQRVKAAAEAGSSHPLADKVADLQAVFAGLSDTADSPSMGRTLRKLDLTRTVTKLDDEGNAVQAEEPIELGFKYYGARFRGSGTLKPRSNNEYEGDIGGLKEDVAFVVKADDFTSRPQRIRLIPQPTLKKLYRIQEEPAYLHHAPPQGESYEYLKGKRQLMGERALSLTGERSVFVVPAGTQLTLFAEAYTDDAGTMSDNDAIVSAFAEPVAGRFPGALFGDDGKITGRPVPVAVSPDGKGFSITFRNTWDDMGPFTRAAVSALQGVYPAKDARTVVDFRLKEKVEFKVTWANRYDVTTTRTFAIQVAEDQPPVVEVGIDVVRKVGNTYMVTPKARIPLNPDSFVRDEHGLSQVEYLYEYRAEDSDLVRAIRAGLVTRAFLSAPHAGPLNPNTLVLPRYHAENFRTLDKSDDSTSGSATLAAFAHQASGLKRRTADDFRAALNTPRADEVNPEAVRKIDLKDERRDFFDLDAKYPDGHPKAGQRVFPILADPGEPQPIYGMTLYVQATDNNADGGPRVTRSAEPIRLRIVSESDLLIEISKEEIQLGERLTEALVKLAAAKKKYEFVRSSNGYKDETPENVDSVKVRHQDALQDVDKARDITGTVLREFRRIARECEVNRLNPLALKSFVSYCADLDEILSEDPNAKVAFPKTLVMLNNAQNTLNNGRWAPVGDVTLTEQSIYQLEAALRAIRDKIGGDDDKKKIIERLREQIERQKLVEKVLVDLKRKWEEEQGAKTVALTVTDGPPLSLNKNETKRVKHRINWRQYPDQDVVVTVKASDASITVPAELKLDFEKNEFTFEFDVKAGGVAGNFTITLKPGQGKEVEMPVTVK